MYTINVIHGTRYKNRRLNKTGKSICDSIVFTSIIFNFHYSDK